MNFGDDIKNSVDCLRKGGVLLYPTDTIWGLGCDATNNAAVEKIFSIKSRNSLKSLLILVDSEAMLERYVREVPEIARELIAVSDSPLTIVYPAGKNLADGVCSEDGSVGIRVCSDAFCTSLISSFRKPVVSTSANISGMPTPGNFSEIDEIVKNSADYVVKYRQDDKAKHPASPVIRLAPDGSIKIIRN